MELAEHIAAARAGEGDPAEMVGEFRRSVVLVPLVEGALWTAEYQGVRWLHAFSDEEQLALFAQAWGAGPEDGEEWEYASVLGARLLDVFLPQMGGPAGVAVDVADEEGSMLLPPVRGVVPDAVAVDAAEEEQAGGGS